MTLRMPVRQDVLGLEVIPRDNDATLIANTGQAFTKVGTPKLLPLRTGWAFEAADAIRFAAAVVNALINAGASGFTTTISLRAPRATMANLPAKQNAFNYGDAADNTAHGLDLYGKNGAVVLESWVAYTLVDYEGLDDSGVHPIPTLGDGQVVVSIRYRRTDPAGQRLAWFINRVEQPADEYAPGAGPNTTAGTIMQVPGGFLQLGASVAATPAVPRVGGFWWHTAALSDAEISAAHLFVMQQEALEPETTAQPALAWPLDVAVADRIMNDTTLRALLEATAGVYSGMAPRGTALDYVVLGSSSENDLPFFNAQSGATGSLMVHWFTSAQDKRDAAAIWQHLKRLLHRQSLYVDGFGICAAQLELISIEAEPDGSAFHGVARLEANAV